MAIKGTAQLHEEFEELRSTSWFQGLFAAAWILLLSSTFSLYTLLAANHFFQSPTLLLIPNILLLLLALILLRIRFHMGQMSRKEHTPLILLRAMHQYRPFVTFILILGALCSLVLPLNFLSEGSEIHQYNCHIRPSDFDPKTAGNTPYLLYISCQNLQAPPPIFKVNASLWSHFQGGANVKLETRKGWLGERWLNIPTPNTQQNAN
ncbi:hypothetical protein COW36_10205 [bacterium (Candidatus Blackallbacteria) CG17_big_fil_post_rev_8_21_14_2_50_48_46]|uniref:Uncharacterized protein n=1 Tax=bacterium (Candidatus Blackallbacteria) CG17_big_fil_post_rev_8_21_14_2_50_48_46 TaxID=2014261 RepID=A0A2M7G5Y3_9BACT|nr:MAG: hypothetical protein COW64_19975 [bacterium (Candidatus Blackallbacteria) CG18_big_fil_WC_8_21_14_2_50_49_26]PIW17005.1 MAG: hypothetical protein COW36_10205 [bacterium (Candidatus Blackallbacteria) CG17_big_fil_post_rev_8_21_14_2_50_48_46]PIW48187.1 MAG: hypothetical protein COW20_10470 [bacterium (Candidatus Blackallbacteria) CG13_big_fil_rev_8_21_14_2_50_49_14]